MATLQMNFLSMKLGMQTNVSVFLPSYVPSPDSAAKPFAELYPAGERFPVLWLLGTETGDDGEAANDSSEAQEEAPLTIAQMRTCVDNFSRLIDQSNVVSAKSSQIDLMKEMLIKAGGLLYKNKNAEIDDEAVEVISDVVGTYKGKIVDSSVIEKVVGYDRGDNPKSFVNYEMKYIISPVFIMIDKAARVEYHEGCTSLYQFVVTDLLHALCDKLGVDFKKDKFCRDLLSALDELITAKWKSVISF